MADAAAARREARRKRILENSENRLQRIFGTSKDEPKEEKSDNVTCNRPTPKVDNGRTSAKDEMTPDVKTKVVLEQDKTSDKSAIKNTESTSQYSQPHSRFAFKLVDEEYSEKSNAKDCDNSNSTPLLEQTPLKPEQRALLSLLFFNPFSYILLAAFVNILLITGVDFSLYQGIVTPFLILKITRLCLEIKSEESQGSNMLVAALILCNVKPEVVYSFKKALSICTAIPRDFALYLTSFVLFNWILSILWTGSNFLQIF